MNSSDKIMPDFELLEPRLLMSAVGPLGAPFDTAQVVDVAPADTVSVAGQVPAAGESTMYRFTVPGTGTIRLDLNAQGGGLDPFMTVYNEAGKAKGTNDNANGTLDSQLAMKVKNGQVYYVQAAGTGGSTGQYSLSFTSEPKDDAGNTIAAAKALRLRRGKAKGKGLLNYQGDADVFSIVTQNASQMTIDLFGSGRSSLFTGEVILYDAQGTEVSRHASQISVKVGASETYYIMVTGNFGGSKASDRYKLNVAIPQDTIGNTIGNALSIQMRRGKGKANSSIDFDWDVDMMRVVTTSAAPLTVQLLPKGRRSTFNGELSIYDAQGTKIAYYDDPLSGAVTLSANTVMGETYYIGVASADGSIGKYKLNVLSPVDDHGDTIGDATAMSQRSSSGKAKGRLDFLGDVDMFSMTSPVNGQMQVRFSGSGRSNTIAPEVTVYDGQGDVVAHNDGNGAGGISEFSFNVDQASTYYILVEDAAGTAMGKYSLLASTTESPVTLRSVDNSSALSGYITQDIVFDTDTDWLSAQLVVTLTNGSVYQDAFGGVLSRNPVLFGIRPSVEFDSYLSNGVLSESVGTTSALDLGGPTKQFDENGVSIGWFTTNNDEVGSLALARITLSSDAVGTWQFLASAVDAGQARIVGGTISAGTMVIS